MRKQINRSTRVFVILLSIALFMPPAPPERPHWSIEVKMTKEGENFLEVYFDVTKVQKDDPKASLGYEWESNGVIFRTAAVAPNIEQATLWLLENAHDEAVQAADSYAREANEDPAKWAGFTIKVVGPDFESELRP